MKVFLPRLVFLVALAFGLAVPAAAQTTLHFSGAYPNVIDQGDYRLACLEAGAPCSGGFGAWDAGDPRYPGADAIFANSVFGGTTLTSHVGPFDLFSIVLAGIFPHADPMTIDFVGVLSGGGNVFQSFVIPASPVSPTLATYAFSADFRGLESVHWSNDGLFNSAQFNDITVAATVTPEPVSMLLLGTGLAGLGALRRRRRGAQVA